MKNNLSFAILALTVLAGLILSLVDAGASPEPTSSSTTISSSAIVTGQN